MSHNVDAVHYVGDGRLHIRRGDAVGLWACHEQDFPEADFISELNRTDQLFRGDPDEMLLITEVNFWGGECSGSGYDLLIEMLGQTEGFAQLVLVYEGGEDIDGLEVHDGVVTEKGVRFELV